MQAGYRRGLGDALFEEGMDQVDRAVQETVDELVEAMENYPPMASSHEGYAVILEELEELWEEIRMKPSVRDPEKMREEARQVAAMALRFMADVTPVVDLTEAEE